MSRHKADLCMCVSAATTDYCLFQLILQIILSGSIHSFHYKMTPLNSVQETVQNLATVHLSSRKAGKSLPYQYIT